MKTSSFFPICAGTFLLGGCTATYYIPNTQNVPVIDAAGHAHVAVSGNGDQAELQAAYGLTDALAVQANGSWFIPNDEENGNGGSGKLFEGGLGYYRNLGEDWHFDTYALIGAGTMENHFPSTLPTDPATTGKIRADLLRYGIQPSITFRRAHFSISGSARVSQLHYGPIDGSLVLNGTDQVRYLNGNDSHVLLEPALTIRGGLEHIRLQLQVMRSLNLTDTDFEQKDGLVSIGIGFDLGK